MLLGLLAEFDDRFVIFIYQNPNIFFIMPCEAAYFTKTDNERN